MDFSPDQSAALEAIEQVMAQAGVSMAGAVAPQGDDADRAGSGCRVVAVMGRAGSGKTRLLAALVGALDKAGVATVSADPDIPVVPGARNMAVLAPTNKAASVLRAAGVPATTIHRILYTPVYDPEYERIAQWLAGSGPMPQVEGLADTALTRAKAFYEQTKSVPAALASAGLRGSDFITGWKRRDDPLDIGLVDECSMLDDAQLNDLKEIFQVLVLFGDPAQLAPVGQSGKMCFDSLPAADCLILSRIHRQEADSPILDLAHALADPAIEFADFERLVEAAARSDPRVVIAPRADPDLMVKAPMLVWRNATRIRLIHAFRAAHGAPPDALLPGEPLICDGLELPARHRKRRMEMEARGLIRGAQAEYLGPGRQRGFARLRLPDSVPPRMQVAAIIRIEAPDEAEPVITTAASLGATFLHGAATTIHKAQGSQWPDVQVFAPDLYAAARSGRIEAGLPLWKRLAYVAVTRAEQRLLWVTRYAMSRPRQPLLPAAAQEPGLDLDPPDKTLAIAPSPDPAA